MDFSKTILGIELGSTRIKGVLIDENHQVIATGSHGWKWMPELVRSKGVDLAGQSSIDMREYIYNMPTLMAAADVYIGRAGSATCNEVAAAGTPAILIPSPNVTDNHQEKNARVLTEQGAAVLLLEPDCTGEVLYDQVMALLADAPKCKEMSAKLRNMAILDSAERICDIMESLCKN